MSREISRYGNHAWTESITYQVRNRGFVECLKCGCVTQWHKTEDLETECKLEEQPQWWMS